MGYKKIAVRGGHTFTCPGASSSLMDETTEDRKVKDYLIKYLQQSGVEVLDVTPPDSCNTQSKELTYGVTMANNWGADLFISCHFNNCYDTIKSAPMGTEVVVYNYSDVGASVAREICNLGFNMRNPDSGGQLISPRGLYELKATNMKALIIEPCFVESSADVAIYRKVGPEGIASAIAKGILGESAVVTGKWEQNNKGYWYQYSDGTYPTNKVLTIDGEIYGFDQYGYMVTGWKQFDDIWYYFYSEGQAATGWVKIGDYWYYLTSEGQMKTGWVKNGSWYYLDEEGRMVTGWKLIGGSWYYLYSNGEMATGWIKSNGKDYYLMDSGVMATGWIKLNGEWYLLDTRDGHMLTGWQEVDCQLYYLYSDGKMAHDEKNLYGYSIDSSGVCTKIN